MFFSLQFVKKWQTHCQLSQVLMKDQQPQLGCRLDTINNKAVKSCHQELA